MKEKLFYLAMGALMFSSCTSEEVIEGGSEMNAISFENVVNKPSRAVADGQEMTASDLDKFYVYGYYTMPGFYGDAIQVFNATEVTKGDDGKWTYDVTRFWVPEATYQFYAYSCGDLKLNDSYGSFSMNTALGSDTERALKINNYLCDNTHQHDLIYATASKTAEKAGSSVANGRIGFAFEHLLTRVQAKFTNLFPDGYTVKIKNVKITNIFNEGNFDPYATPQWNGLEIKRTGSQDTYVNLTYKTTTLTSTSSNDPAVSDGAFVIPNNYTSGEKTQGSVTIKFDIEVYNGDVKVFSTPMSGSWSPIWNKGYKYTYNINLSASQAGLEAIVFTVDENGFGGFSEGDVPTLTIQVPGTIPGIGE